MNTPSSLPNLLKVDEQSNVHLQMNSSSISGENNQITHCSVNLPDKQDSSQKILVLCGVVGSGKSTFASELEKRNPNFVRISQDVLGSRNACERKARRSLEQGKSIVIDRQNFDSKQRETWVKLAQEFSIKSGQSNLEINLIEFATSYEECARRLKLRTGHETLHSVSEAIGVLKLTSKNWVAPTLSEGFDRHLILVPKALRLPGSPLIETPFSTTEHVLKPVMDKLNLIISAKNSNLDSTRSTHAI